jgi:hypothetical protein
MNTGEKCQRLHDDGFTWREIAAELGLVTSDAARNRARRWRRRQQTPPIPPHKQGDTLEVQEIKGNTIEVLYEGRRIISLDDLLELLNYDPDDWRVERHIINKWEVGAKDALGNIVIEPLFQVKAWFVPTEPKPVHPVILPVRYTGKIIKPKPPRKRAFKRHLVWGDPQFGFRRRVHDAKLTPFHDRRALDIVLQIAHAAKPDRIDCLGDWFDAAEWTDRFLRSPEFYFAFQPAICESHWWLTQLVAVCENRIHEGNHDARIPNAIKRHLPFAYGLRQATEIEAPSVLSVSSLLELDALGVEYVADYPNDRDWLAEKLEIRHGNIARSKPLDTVKALARGDVSRIVGHIHRREMATNVREDANGFFEVVGCSLGCTCHIDYRVPGHAHNQTWTQGLGIIDVFDNKRFSITPIAIENGVAIWNGQMFEARDRIPELKEALPDWNW